VAFQALLAGDGFLRDQVRAEHARLGLDGTLIIAGWQDDADSLIAAADVFVLSSSEEGQGSVLLDAMQCRKPVAATRAGGIPDVVLDGETGLLVAPGDPVALGGAIARLCSEPDLRGRLGAAGGRRVADFAIERVAEATVAVYRQALSGPS
jgi:glycosyltransferase involved in cell wall biosynthesis